MRIVIEESILKTIEQKCKPEAGRDHFLPRDLVNPLRVFIDKELEELNSKLYNLYKNRNYRGTDERTLRHAWGRGEKYQDGAIKELRDLLCYFGFSKNWDATLKQLGIDHKNIQGKTIQAESLHQIENRTTLLKFNDSHFASKIYIELITRKAAIPIDLEKDVIEEIYNSWYVLYKIIRAEMSTLSPSNFQGYSLDSPLGIAMKILIEIIGSHLTEHQAKFRHWLDKAKKDSKFKKFSPQEIQKKYPEYLSLTKSLLRANSQLLDISKKLKEFCV